MKTIAEYEEQYVDNILHGGDLAKMRLALEALSALRVLRARQMGSANSQITYGDIDAEIADLQKAINRTGRGGISVARAVVS